MVYRIAAISMTLSDLQSHSPVASLFKFSFDIIDYDRKISFLKGINVIPLKNEILAGHSHDISKNKDSSGDEIANANFFTRHRTCRGQRLRPLKGLPNFYYKYLCYA